MEYRKGGVLCQGIWAGLLTLRCFTVERILGDLFTGSEGVLTARVILRRDSLRRIRPAQATAFHAKAKGSYRFKNLGGSWDWP